MIMEKVKTGFKLGTKKVEVLHTLGEVKHNGRTYRLVKVRVSSGEEYLSLRLYNARGKFIKQFMMEPEIGRDIGCLLNWANMDIGDALVEAETKAWQSLARYKFQMFGYWSSIWVHLNKISNSKRPNPFACLVSTAKEEVASQISMNRCPSLFKD